METVWNEFPNGTSERTFVVTCYQTVALRSPHSVPIEKSSPPHLLAPLLREALLAPRKDGVDVSLARTPDVDTTRAWLSDSPEREPRPIVQALLSPVGTPRFRHLTAANAKDWARRGGLQSIPLRAPGGRWQCQVCDIPEEVVPSYFNVAPPEQQFAHLTCNEVVWVDSSKGRMWSRLPGARVTVWALDVSPAELVPMTLDTLVVDPDLLEAILFWRGRVTRPVDHGHLRIVSELVIDPHRQHSDRPPELISAALARTDTIELQAQQDEIHAPEASVGFLKAPLSFPPPAIPPPLPPPMLPAVPSVPRGCVTPVWEETTADAEAPNTDRAVSGDSDSVLPFRAEAGVGSTTSSAPPSGLAITSPDLHPAPPAIAAPPALPGGSYYSYATLPIAPPAASLPRPTYAVCEAEKLAPTAGPAPAPAFDLTATQAPTQDPLPSIEPEVQATSARECSLEEIARLDAEMQMGATCFQKSLASHGMGVADLASHRTKWQEAMADEARSGRRQLQQQYDLTMLTRWEELRGAPITNEEYARLAVAVERMNVDEVVGELGLPASGILVLTRIFSERTATSAALRDELRTQIRRARQ